ncbi:hypothetical protein H0H93_007253 [Arthromyces matolae]|nr:hypothetical protein H0H93_007253 [Arthromyces matolae]
MSIDVNEAIIAIREMRPIIDPEEDYLTIVAAEEKIAAAESRRKKELEEGHGNMKGRFCYHQVYNPTQRKCTALAKLLESARLSSRRPGSVPSEQAHGKMLNELDKLKLDLMKSISDLESLVVSQETELATLRDEAHRLEEYDPALEHKKELDGSA